jgi:hypothetical protein
MLSRSESSLAEQLFGFLGNMYGLSHSASFPKNFLSFDIAVHRSHGQATEVWYCLQ